MACWLMLTSSGKTDRRRRLRAYRWSTFVLSSQYFIHRGQTQQTTSIASRHEAIYCQEEYSTAGVQAIDSCPWLHLWCIAAYVLQCVASEGSVRAGKHQQRNWWRESGRESGRERQRTRAGSCCKSNACKTGHYSLLAAVLCCVGVLNCAHLHTPHPADLSRLLPCQMQ